MGDNFEISAFYVDGYNGGNVSRTGGGGSNVCCVMLPGKWRRELVVELRWSVSDLSKENEKEKVYKALVPVEKYDDAPGQLYAHFFRWWKGARSR
jgi:hypothetical protein